MFNRFSNYGLQVARQAGGRSALGSSIAARTLAPCVAPALSTPSRFFNLHEYQSKELLGKYDIRIQRGQVANNPEEAYEIAKQLKDTNAEELVLKAQIHAGGRGKGTFTSGFKGGVKIVEEPEDVRDLSKHMFGGTLVTHQTGPEGQQVHKCLIHEGVPYKGAKEFYFAILLDRSMGGPVVVASAEGGVEIEQTAEDNPEAIHKIPVDITAGMTNEKAMEAAAAIGLSGAAAEDAANEMKKLYNLFIGLDCTQVEINPFLLTADGRMFCVDAKLGFDENAAYRQKDVFAMRDPSMEDPREVEASKVGLNYVGLDGNIGCMVNGAGLAMATMDIIAMYGGKPANFLDVGGGANEKQVEEALRILTADPNVKAILVNIFGGIMKCDTIATGIANAAKNIGLNLPMVVRLEGTNVDKGVEILQNCGQDFITATNLDDAAQKACATLKQ